MFFGGGKGERQFSRWKEEKLNANDDDFPLFSARFTRKKKLSRFQFNNQKKRGANVLTCDEEQSFVLMKIHIIPLDETIAVGFSYLRSA